MGIALVLAVGAALGADAEAEKTPAAPEESPPEKKDAGAKKVTVEEPIQDKACAICEAKRRFHELAPWFELGADLRLRLYVQKNQKLDKHDHKSNDWLWHRHRARVWAKISPLEDLSFNIRLMSEPRFWCAPEFKDSVTHDEAMFDQLNVQWRNAFDLPLTFTLGRQDFSFGEGWTLHDGTPLDGGRSTFFDAARATLDLKDIQTTFDLIYIDNHADTAKWIRPFGDEDFDIAEHDEQGAIFYVSNKSLENHTLDAYFVYKHDEKVSSNGWNSDLYNFGLRAKGSMTDHWKYRTEVVSQFGRKNGRRVCALGSNNELAYHVNDRWKNVFRAQYEYRSGDRNSQDGAFDPLWGRWYQGSNLWHFYLAKLETVLAAPSNYHRASIGWACKPTKKLSANVDYHLLFRDENTYAGTPGFSDGGCFRGQLITGMLNYKFNEHVKSHLMLDVFMPGDYYSDARNDVAFFLKYQIVFSW